MHEGDHNVRWGGRNACKHEVRRGEGLGKDCGGGYSITAKMQMHRLCLGGDGMGAEVLESLAEPWLQTAAGGS